MDDALPSEPRMIENLPRRAKRLTRVTSAPDLASPDVTYTFKVLSAGAGEGEAAGAFRTVLFQRISGGEAIEISAETDAPNLFEQLPEFIEAAIEVQRLLGLAQGREGAPLSEGAEGIAEQERVLRLFNSEHGAIDAQRAIERQARFCEVMIVRDIAADALKSALGKPRRLEIDAMIFLHETPKALCESLERIATYIEQRLKDAADAARLWACDLDAAYATSLRKHAAALADVESAPPATPEDEPKKRGRLRLIGTAYRTLPIKASPALPGLSALSWVRGASADSPVKRRSKRKTNEEEKRQGDTAPGPNKGLS